MTSQKSILNYELLERDLEVFKEKHIIAEIPILNIQKEIDFVDMDKLKDTILKMAKEFPHSRVAVTYDPSLKDIKMEIHPVTGAA